MPPNAWCPSRRREWLPRAAWSDALPCSWHHLTDEGLQVVWPRGVPPVGAQGRGLQSDGPRRRSPRRGDRAEPSQRRAGRRRFEIASPPSGATYLIDPTLRREFQTLPLRVDAATARRPIVTWSINGRSLGTASSRSRARRGPSLPGTHQIIARDARGQRRRRRIASSIALKSPEFDSCSILAMATPTSAKMLRHHIARRSHAPASPAALSQPTRAAAAIAFVGRHRASDGPRDRPPRPDRRRS